MSTAYHPQSNGQTEVVNRCLECILRCMTGERPKEWTKWLALAEYWYNTNFHTSIGTTPFEVVYCQTPPIHLPYLSSESKVDSVDKTLLAREQVIEMLKFHLKRTKDRMKLDRTLITCMKRRHRDSSSDDVMEFDDGGRTYALLREIGEPLGAEEMMVDSVIDEVAELMVEVEEQMVALVVDIKEDLAMLFGDDDFSDDGFEGFKDDEELWEVNE
nr:Ty3/gypsy retrotransposon protein [Tanacetum cinerariifolium]